MRAKWMIVGIGIVAMPLALLGIDANGKTQPEEKVFPEEARRRLDYTVGSWKSRTQSLDRKGEVVRTSFSETERKFVIEDRVVEIAGVIKATGMTFRAWEYYDARNDKYSLTSIDREGSVFTLSGELGEEFRWTSESREQPDGSLFAMRFTHSDFKADSFTALGEISRDGGRTWRAFTRQFMSRQRE